MPADVAAERPALLSLVALAGLAPATARAAAAGDDAALRRFADSLSALKPRESLDPVSQDAHVLAAAAAGVLLERLPEVGLTPIGAFAPGAETGRVGRFGPCVVVRYRLQPHAVQPPHNHPHYSVATVGLAGEAVFEQFTPDGPPPPFDSPAPFRLRKVSERSLSAGTAVTLAPERDNIHTFRAGPAGAEFFDIISLHGQDVGFSYLEIPGRWQVGETGEARWRRTVNGVPVGG